MPESQIQVRLNPHVTPTGSDLAVVNAARRSFNSRSDWECDGTTPDYHITYKPTLKDKDKRLIEFLARGMTADDFDEFLCDITLGLNYKEVEVFYKDLTEKLWEWRNTPTHDTPFNHCFISFECKAPIFVHRQLVKHEYLICSEFSRRYITDDIEFYTPDYWRKAAKDKKQGSLEESVEIDPTEPYRLWQEQWKECFEAFLEVGVAPEQARMVLPQSTMTEWTWSGTLGAFAKMCQLRLHKDAQYETRVVAQKVYDYLKEYYPVSAKCLVEGVK